MSFNEIAVVGAGAVGLSIYSYLNLYNIECQLVTKQECIQPLLVKTPKNHFTLRPSNINHDEIQTLFLCVKSYDLVEVLNSLRAKLSYTCTIILPQNGYGYQKKVNQLFSQYNIVYMSCMFGARIINKNTLQLSNEPKVTIGSYKQSDLSAIKKLLEQAKFDVQISNDIDFVLKFKLIINASLNALGAIYKCSHQELFNHYETRKKVKELCFESTAILNQDGYKLSGVIMWQHLLQILPNISSNSSSMLTDVLQYKQTEIADINGYLIDLACQYGVSCKHNIKVVNQIESLYDSNH